MIERTLPGPVQRNDATMKQSKGILRFHTSSTSLSLILLVFSQINVVFGANTFSFSRPNVAMGNNMEIMMCNRAASVVNGKTNIFCTFSFQESDFEEGGEEKTFQACLPKTSDKEGNNKSCVTASVTLSDKLTKTSEKSQSRKEATKSVVLEALKESLSKTKTETDSTASVANEEKVDETASVINESMNDVWSTKKDPEAAKVASEKTDAFSMPEADQSIDTSTKTTTTTQTINGEEIKITITAGRGGTYYNKEKTQQLENQQQQQQPKQPKQPPDRSDDGTIVVGTASYRKPYDQYGTAVAKVLEKYHGLQFLNLPSIDMVEWHLNLGNAHFDDAQFGMFFDDYSQKETSDLANMPKNYHLELALQAYEWGSKSLFKLTTEEQLNNINPSTEGNKMLIVHLQYYAILEFSKGEANSVAAVNAGGYSASPSTEGKDYNTRALSNYRKAQSSFERLRYLYARLSAAATAANGGYEVDDYYFGKDRYEMIENTYAHSCFQLGMSLYAQLIESQNAQVLMANEKTMELIKSQMGLKADASQEEIVQALMDQAGGGLGTTGGGGSAFSFNLDASSLDLGELTALIGVGQPSEDTNAKYDEISALLDTAILTYQQHAESSSYKKKGQSMKVIVNGKERKSLQELEEEEALFHWQASLAMAYQSAAVVATARNQHIRSRELMNSALELYTEIILPFYDEQSERNRRIKAKRGNIHKSAISTGRSMTDTGYSPTSMSSMTPEYAKVSAGDLYVTLANTAIKLGSYKESNRIYAKAMAWHIKYKLPPGSNGELFNNLGGDEATMREYKDFINTYREELNNYFKDVDAMRIYKDDNYVAQMCLTLAPLYMAIGNAAQAIGFYKDAINAYQRLIKGDMLSEENKVHLKGVAEARLGLSTALFYLGSYKESKLEHQNVCEIYEHIYGEGTPAMLDSEAAIEGMKDELIENYGEAYYEQLKSMYSANDKAGGKGADNPKLATNFEIQDYHNETLNGEELEEASDDDEYEWYYYEDTDESNEGETDSTEKPTFKDEEL